MKYNAIKNGLIKTRTIDGSSENQNSIQSAIKRLERCPEVKEERRKINCNIIPKIEQN